MCSRAFLAYRTIQHAFQLESLEPHQKAFPLMKIRLRTAMGQSIKTLLTLFSQQHCADPDFDG